MDAFLQATALIGIAEMGDKSQLAALAFASRFSARLTLASIAAATLVVHLLSVLLGETLGGALPSFWIQLLAGLAFVGFGWWTLRGDSYDDDQDRPKTHRFGAFLSVASTFFLAELGDKTMLATVTLGSQLNAFVAVWLGSTLGMVAADAVAIGVGQLLGTRLPERAIKFGVAAMFVAFGVWTLASTLSGAAG